MATKPGILTDWPWACLGNYKYVVLAPWVTHSVCSYIVRDENEKDISNLLILPLLIWRMVHNQIWISLSRYRTAKGNNRILDKSIEFEQVDRERNWDDQIILGGTLMYSVAMFYKAAQQLPWWKTSGLMWAFLVHAGPVEFLYYWLHRALHHHFLYSRYHSHHHSSIVTDVVHLTHLTTPESIYQLRLGFAYLASAPQKSKWYFWLMWPVTLWSMMVTWIYGRTFIVERNVFKHLKLQTWAIPKYSIQYYMQWQREVINSMIEDSILEAEAKGVRVLSLGLLNQSQGLNQNGELFIRRHPQLKIKLVDGSSLVVAVVLNSIPKGTTQVVLRGTLSKVAYSIALALCQGGTQVYITTEEDYRKLKAKLTNEAGNNLILSKHNASKTWLVGNGLSEKDQLKASKGTFFIPLSQFPPKKMRKDCLYYNTPAMLAPKHLENVDACENWLPRRVMSAWRIAGIVHAMEGWGVHECGNMMFDIEKIWQASLKHGFRPLMNTNSHLPAEQ